MRYRSSANRGNQPMDQSASGSEQAQETGQDKPSSQGSEQRSLLQTPIGDGQVPGSEQNDHSSSDNGPSTPGICTRTMENHPERNGSPDSREVISPTRKQSGKKQVAKRGAHTRLFLMLLDGKQHEFSEFYDYVASAIEPNIALRAYHRNYKGERNTAESNPQEALEEGRRIVLLSSVWTFCTNGYAKVEYPEPIFRSKKRGNGYINLRKAKLQLTEKGFEFILNSRNTWGRITPELYLGLKFGKLTVEVKIKP